jgi:hypothetical protein
MADFATALRTRLLADSDVSGVTTRIHWNLVPQGVALPYIRLQTISDDRSQHLKGYDTARVTRIQCDCFASSYGTARALAEHVIDAVASPTTVGGVQFGRTKAEGPRDLGEDVDGIGFIHRASVDLLAEHKMV